MSAKKHSRAFAEGKIKALRRIKQPIVLHLAISNPPRNPVARALVERAINASAGRHIRSQGAQRRADRMALQRALRQPEERA